MFKIKRSDDGQFYWVLVGKNGEPLGNGELHTRKEKAFESAEAVIDLILSNPDIEFGDFTGDLRRRKGLERSKPTDNGAESTLQTFDKGTPPGQR